MTTLRAIERAALPTISAIVACMIIAVIGRADDWSLFAMVLLGAVAGFLACFGTLWLAWQSDREEDER